MPGISGVPARNGRNGHLAGSSPLLADEWARTTATRAAHKFTSSIAMKVSVLRLEVSLAWLDGLLLAGKACTLLEVQVRYAIFCLLGRLFETKSCDLICHHNLI